MRTSIKEVNKVSGKTGVAEVTLVFYICRYIRFIKRNADFPHISKVNLAGIRVALVIGGSANMKLVLSSLLFFAAPILISVCLLNNKIC